MLPQKRRREKENLQLDQHYRKAKRAIMKKFKYKQWTVLESALDITPFKVYCPICKTVNGQFVGCFCDGSHKEFKRIKAILQLKEI